MSTKNSNFFSRDCMVQALIQLLKTKSLSNITITELTERAGVSRMTYYRNYHSLDEIFSSYLKDLVESYRQDVATWPDKGNYNDSRNMLHCYEYFNHYKEFIACLVQHRLLGIQKDLRLLPVSFLRKTGRFQGRSDHL